MPANILDFRADDEQYKVEYEDAANHKHAWVTEDQIIFPSSSPHSDIYLSKYLED